MSFGYRDKFAAARREALGEDLDNHDHAEDTLAEDTPTDAAGAGPLTEAPASPVSAGGPAAPAPAALHDTDEEAPA